MNLTMTTQWTKNDHRTYLIVTVSANDTTEATASQTYLDIQMPEGMRIRHIGELPTDGHGNSIGVDLPDLAAGEHQDIVFKVKSRRETDDSVAPELHLHWIDSSSGDLVERHQTGAPIPTESTEEDERLKEIVATARSNNRTSRRDFRRHDLNKENEFMNTERNEQSHNHSRGRCGHRRHNRDAFMAGRGVGRRAGRRMHGAWGESSPRGHRHGNGHLYRIIGDMQDRIDEMERRMHRMKRLQRMAKDRRMEIGGRFEHRDGARRCGRPHGGERALRFQEEGRRMGRMMHRAWRDRQPDA